MTLSQHFFPPRRVLAASPPASPLPPQVTCPPSRSLRPWSTPWRFDPHSSWDSFCVDSTFTSYYMLCCATSSSASLLLPIQDKISLSGENGHQWEKLRQIWITEKIWSRFRGLETARKHLKYLWLALLVAWVWFQLGPLQHVTPDPPSPPFPVWTLAVPVKGNIITWKNKSFWFHFLKF